MAYESKIKSKEVDELFRGILSLETEEECYRFFEDLCTFKEVLSMAQRLQVAKMLKQKKTYGMIEAETKASTATISRINKFLQYGSDGYGLILDRLLEQKKQEEAEAETEMEDETDTKTKKK